MPPDDEEKRWLVSQVETLRREIKELTPRSEAWFAVITVLHEVAPGFLRAEGSGEACAVNAIKELKKQLAEKATQICGLRCGLEAVESLMNESRGVAGLHLNGNLAPWGELRNGGRFEEWLKPFDDALSSSPSCPHKEKTEKLKAENG